MISRFPLLTLVTMRGEWAEFNPWQVPMGQATEAALKAIGVRSLRADTAQDLVETVAAGMAGPLFQAKVNPGCRNCPVRSCCPVHPEGGQVTP